MPVVVRSAVLADLPRLVRINIETWRTAFAGIVPASYLDGLDVAAFEERWRGYLTQDRPDVVLRVAEVDGVLASYAFAGPYRTQQDASPDEDTTGWAELYALYSHPDLQGRGGGGAVHDAVLAWLAETGYRTAALWVLSDNAPSRSWYAGRGWRPDGTTSRWEGAGTPLDEVRMVRDLDHPRDGRPAPPR